MTATLDLLGWLFINIAVPLLAPVALLPIARVPRFYRRHSRGIVVRAVQDGQLLWTVIAMSASACHALAGQFNVDLPPGPQRLVWLGITWHVGMIVGASGLVLVGAMDAHPARRGADLQPNHILRLSVVLAMLAAVSCSAVRALGS
ncbi:hypothetical protein AB4120_05055 [Cupriavidus sp. 2KB_3]|uniref:hypothetical protein n=1 Tax=Cupriavidus TaxID=106589 RepID=UPI0011ED15A4|nr:hypothetical protein [Cupriavidus campinensis]